MLPVLLGEHPPLETGRWGDAAELGALKDLDTAQEDPGVREIGGAVGGMDGAACAIGGISHHPDVDERWGALKEPHQVNELRMAISQIAHNKTPVQTISPPRIMLPF
ncbi:hypothetical protein NDU88_004465 [Pleurodeles waltl]|uniref:Uncharacterized protein n=1 Tax=Pleurodeles waltl TaxID=8319 RepID=A0AAV7W937_PLEWA|nr:hypothetical protein NDU88_004465 [Pleurodeles waltl]